MNQPNPWVIRTAFSDDKAWLKIKDLIAAPQGGFVAYVTFVSEETHRDQTPQQVVLSLPDDYPGHFCFVVDQETIEKPEHPILVIGFHPSDMKSFDRKPNKTPPGDIVTFRALPSQIQSIENNLSIANMDFEEFAGAAGKDGVFRGFP